MILPRVLPPGPVPRAWMPDREIPVDFLPFFPNNDDVRLKRYLEMRIATMWIPTVEEKTSRDSSPCCGARWREARAKVRCSSSPRWRSICWCRSRAITRVIRAGRTPVTSIGSPTRAGVAGAWLADVLLYLFGFMAYLFPVMIGYSGWLVYRGLKVAPVTISTSITPRFAPPDAWWRCAPDAVSRPCTIRAVRASRRRRRHHRQLRGERSRGRRQSPRRHPVPARPVPHRRHPVHRAVVARRDGRDGPLHHPDRRAPVRARPPRPGNAGSRAAQAGAGSPRSRSSASAGPAASRRASSP